MDFENVQTRDGGRFKLIEILEAGTFPVIGAFEDSYGDWAVGAWTLDGEYDPGVDCPGGNPYDLVPIPKTLYAVIASNDTFDNLEEAQQELARLGGGGHPLHFLYKLELPE